MGLPLINVQFKGMAGAAIKRSQRGIVALLIKDTKASSQVIRGIENIPIVSAMDQKNIDYLNQIFAGGASKIIVEVVKEGTPPGTYLLNESLVNLKVQYFNYLVYPDASSTEVATIVGWIKSARDTSKKTFKTVVSSDIAPDHEGVINFKATGLKIKETGATPTSQEFTGRIAGILAGLPFTRSATYYVIPEIEKVDLITDPDTVIDAGNLILIDDGENIKIASGVNSLTTATSPKSEDMKDILIIEKMDLVKDDISRVFNDNYVGKVLNTYSDKQLFVTNVNTYFESLIRDFNFFDANEINKVEVDYIANKLYLEAKGIDTSLMSEIDLKTVNTGKKVFLKGRVKFTNTMSDLVLELAM